MSHVQKLSIAVTPEMAAMMRHLVAIGEYASTSEVMREALRDWKQRRVERERAIEEIGRLWDIGVASGPAVDGEAAFERINRKLEAKIAAREGK